MAATNGTVVEVRLPAMHPAQAQVARDRRRFNVLSCGRRWGKTTFATNRLLLPALHSQPVAWFSPTYKMMAEVWRDVRQALRPITATFSEQQHRITTTTGGVVDMWSLDQPDAARGRKYRRVVLDEAAMVRDLERAWQAVIRPVLVDYRGGAWFASTPKGFNYFKSLYDLGQDPAMTDWASWQQPTEANPYIPADEVVAARLMLPERTFAQEFLAHFLEDGGGVFRRVLEAVRAEPQGRAVPGHRYAVGVDWGKISDFTVLTVLDTTLNAVVCVDRFNRIDYTVQKGRLVAVCERFTPDTIIAEQNSMGVPLIEDLVRFGLPVQPFQTTNASKAQAIEALGLAFEQGALAIPPHTELLAELQAYDMERLPSGLTRYGAPPGQHDDCVMSLALAWQAVAGGNTLTWDTF